MYNILLVEDEKDIQFANKLMLERRGGYSVRLAMNLKEARARIAEAVPDLIVLDIMLPDGNGLDFLKEIRTKMNLDVPVLLLTALSDTIDELKGLQSGGDDYITKPYDNKVLLASIRRILQRASQIPDTLTIGRVKLDTASKMAFVNNSDMCLSITEYAMLSQFVQHPDKIMSAAFLYEKVWGHSAPDGDGPVKIAVSKLRAKLAYMDAGYTITASRGEGYFLEKV